MASEAGLAAMQAKHLVAQSVYLLHVEALSELADPSAVEKVPLLRGPDRVGVLAKMDRALSQVVCHHDFALFQRSEYRRRGAEDRHREPYEAAVQVRFRHVLRQIRHHALALDQFRDDAMKSHPQHSDDGPRYGAGLRHGEQISDVNQLLGPLELLVGVVLCPP